MKIEKVGAAMSWNLVAKIARFVAQPVGFIIIVRVLGEHDWGVLSVLKTITAFIFVIVPLGTGNAILKYLPTFRVKGGLHLFLRRYRRLVVYQLLVWIALVACARFGGRFLGNLYDVSSERFVPYLVLAVGFVVFEVFMTILTNILQSWYETKRLGIVIVLGNIGYLVFLILFLKMGWGITGVLAAGALVNLSMSLLLLPKIVALVSGETESVGAVPGTRGILRFSLPFVATGVLNQVVWRQSEVLFLGHYHGVEAAGYFDLAYRIPQMLLEFIPLTIWPLVMAAISEAYSHDARTLPRSIGTYYRILYILVTPIATLGFAFARPFVPILFGVQMLPAAQLTQLFFVVFSYSFLYTPLSMSLYVMEKSWINMFVFMLLAVVNIGLDLALIPRFGIWGAFFPVALVLMLSVLVFSLVVKRIRPEIVVPLPFVVRCYSAGIPTALLHFSAVRWSSPPALAVQVVIGVALLMLGFRWMKIIGAEERELIRKLPIPGVNRILAVL